MTRFDGLTGRLLRRLTWCALAGATLPLASQTAAQAAALCHYDPPLHEMSVVVDASWTTVIVEARPDATFDVVVASPAGQQVLPCDGATNTDIEAISVRAGQPAVVAFDASRAAFAPGLSPEPTGASEIELSSTGAGEVAYLPPALSATTVLAAGHDGISVNDDGDVDLMYGGATRVDLYGSDGDDLITAAGGYGTGKALPKRITFVSWQPGPAGLSHGTDTLIGHKGRDELHLDLSASGSATGDAGDDVLSSGAFGPYTLDGGAGNDRFTLHGNDHALGGKGDDWFDGTNGLIDVVDGGKGTDTGYFDPFEELTSVENPIIP
jgi:hypothetical protein